MDRTTVMISWPVCGSHPELLAAALRIVHRVIAGFLFKQAGLKRGAADTGSVTLIQRFGSASNLRIHLHRPVPDAAESTKVPL